jgi:hypothetical protein
MMGFWVSQPSERNMAIYRRRNDGETFTAIAKDYGITPSRANQAYWVTARRLRRIAGVTGMCPTCHQKMPPS